MKNARKVYSTTGKTRKLRPRIKEIEIQKLKRELWRFKASLEKSDRLAWKMEMSKKHGLLVA